MTPVEVLAAHRERRVLVSGFMESRCEGDDCGWRGPVDDWPDHVLDALTKAGHIVVQVRAYGEIAAVVDEVMVCGSQNSDDCAEAIADLVYCQPAAAAAAETGGKA